MIALSAPIDLNYSKLNYTAMKHFNLLKSLLLLCALIVGSLSGWADTVTLSSAQIKSGSGSSSYGACSATDGDGNTWSAYAIKNQHSKATSDYNFWQIKKYASNTAYYIQVPTLGSKITSISLVVSGSSQPRDNGGNSATLYFSNSNSTSTTGVGVVSGTGANSVTLDCSSLNLNSGYITASGAVRIWDIEVTYNPAGPVDARADAGISFAEADIEKTWGESFTGQALSNPNSVDVTYSSTEESVATVSSTGVVTVLKAGSTTIKATFAGNATYKASVASYNLTINKAEAGLSYSENTFDVVLGDESFVAPVLNNPNGLTVTYSSNNTNVAFVDENTGDVVLDASAEATVMITATFAGNDNFKTGSTNYTINIIDPNKKGSKLNPYTVSEVLSASATSDVYVEGYIVGYVTGTTSFTSTIGNSQNSNWAIADLKDETNFANVIGVQLSGTTTQSTYGLTNHKDLVGAKVLVKGDIASYFSKMGIKNLDEFNVEKEVAISAAGWATYCSSNALDFTGVTALTAYTATMEGSVVKFNKVTGKVPANTGLLVRGETANVPVCASADPVDNLLVGVTVEKVKTAGTVFVLMKGSKGIGFYKNTNDFTLRANSAYLPAEGVEGSTARAFIALDDETTGIADVKAVKEDAEGMFDLQGRKIAKPTKGLYIVNGKKIVVK